MRSWFRRPLVTDPSTVQADGLEAYKEGRADEHVRVQRSGVQVDRAVTDAYERGRREEGLRRRGSPIMALITIVLVVIALAVLYLAIRTGSFSGAGAVLDNLIQTPAHAAAEKAGSALESAGQTIKNDAP